MCLGMRGARGLELAMSGFLVIRTARQSAMQPPLTGNDPLVVNPARPSPATRQMRLDPSPFLTAQPKQLPRHPSLLCSTLLCYVAPRPGASMIGVISLNGGNMIRYVNRSYSLN
jgi:hypothetical protein